MSDSINSLSALAAAPLPTTNAKGSTWFQAMADAWGQVLDRQADNIETMSNQIGGGDDKPAIITQLTAETLRMGYLSTSSHTALSSTGEALKTMAQKS